MRIGFYAPFKPLNHPNPSGDLIIASGLVERLTEDGHEVRVMSTLRSRWIYWKPDTFFRALCQRYAIGRKLQRQPIDLWLTYHSYYKAPDLLGPPLTRRLNCPYVIFQGSYATRVARNWRTWPGFILNRLALLAADLVLTNRKDDLHNLRRLLPEKRLRYLAPGIHPRKFSFDPEARKRMRQLWNSGERPVILTAAMFRPDVKSIGIAEVIESCVRLWQRGMDFQLVIAGDGSEKKRLLALAARLPRNRVVFAGLIPRTRMPEFYSGSDLFVFPGINESLGMVYLEAQSCGLPVVAFDNGGIPEVVENGCTGLLIPPGDHDRFDLAVASLLQDRALRRQMGGKAADYVRGRHDLERNYADLGKILGQVVTSRQESGHA